MSPPSSAGNGAPDRSKIEAAAKAVRPSGHACGLRDAPSLAEIEIAAEMIEAGWDVLASSFVDICFTDEKYRDTIISQMFRAMWKRKRTGAAR